LGHRRIGFVYYGEGHSSCDQRLTGFRRALAEYGAELREEDIARNPVRLTEAERLRLLHADIERVLNRESRPTAIFAPSDFLAAEVYRVARRLGLSIPGDLSVMGFANLDFSSLVDPPLTTIRQDGIAMGEAAGAQVLRRLKQPDASTFHYVQPVELIVRESTAAVG
jgi:LacI family transcriptional regulator